MRFSNSPTIEKEFAEAIDAMGHASGAVSKPVAICVPVWSLFQAQGLPTAVTTYNKLKTCKHTLYVLKDMESNEYELVDMLIVCNVLLHVASLLAS